MQTKTTKQMDAFTSSSEITICTATATLQGKEIRQAMDKSFAALYHDLDGGFTPLVRFPSFGSSFRYDADKCLRLRRTLCSRTSPSLLTSVATSPSSRCASSTLVSSRSVAFRTKRYVVSLTVLVWLHLTPAPTQPDEDMLTALSNQVYKTGEPLTDKQIAHIMIALLMAGQHTSAATGSWAILRLGQRPDLQFVPAPLSSTLASLL